MSPGRPKTFDRDGALERAVDVFWSHGYERASLATLVSAMEIGRQSLYDTFGDKRSLFVAALDRYLEKRDDRLAALLGTPAVAPLERVRGLLVHLRERARSDRRGCLAVGAAGEFGGSDALIHERLSGARRELESQLVRVLAEAQDSGAIAASLDVTAWARSCVVSIHGVMVLARDDDSTPFIDATMQMLWSALVPDDTL